MLKKMMNVKKEMEKRGYQKHERARIYINSLKFCRGN